MYFDDFVVFEERTLSKHCEFVVGTFFEMLGWATSIDKENEFSGSLKALGILIDLSEVKLLKVRFSNTDERRIEVTHDIKAILKSGKLNRSEGQRIRDYYLQSHRFMAEGQSDKCKYSQNTFTHVLRWLLTKRQEEPLSFFATSWRLAKRDVYHHWQLKSFTCIVMQATSRTIAALQVLDVCWWILIAISGVTSVNFLVKS